MIIAVETIYMIFLIAIGYIATCYYYNKVKWNVINRKVLKIKGKYKISYLVLTVLLSGVVIAFYQIFYSDFDLVHQMKRLTLLAFIYPMAAVDYKKQVIPNVFICGALIVRGVFYVVEAIISPSTIVSAFVNDLLAVVVIGGFFLLIYFVFKNSIGMGDIKLFMVMGFYQGIWGAINSVFFSLVVSFFLAVALLVSRKKKRKDTISFGPSIMLGTVIGICLSGL